MVYGYRSNYNFFTNAIWSYLMDASKYKSVAIKVAVYNKARPMAEADYCTMGGFIQKLIDDEYKFRQEEKKNAKIRK